MDHLRSFPEVVKTERLTLQPLFDSDYDALIALFRDEVVKQTYMLPDLSDEASADALFCRMKELSEKNDRLVRGIYLEQKLIGVINDVGINDCSIELGYALHPNHHNRAYMTEALSTVIHALKTCGFSTVRAGAFSENAASIRVMEKCGMQRIADTEEIEYRGNTHLCIYYEV